MTRVFFVRHGESQANKDKICAGHTDVELTDLGRDQAKMAGLELAKSGTKIDIIIASPLMRAFETAAVIASCIGYDSTDIIVSDLAIERYRGRYEGQPSSLQEGATDEDYERMGAESVEEMIERSQKLEKMIQSLDKASVLVVSHNQFGCIFIATSRGEEPSAELNKIPNAHVFEV